MMQSPHSKLASATFGNAASGNSITTGRFMDMIKSSRASSEGVEMTLPISGSELVEYTEFLGKGQYLKQTGIVFDPTAHVLEVDYITKHVFLAIDESYQQRFGSSPFRDLEKNPLSEVISNGQCIIWSRDNQYLFIFHDSTAITIKVLERNSENEKKAQKSVNLLLENFRYDPQAPTQN